MAQIFISHSQADRQPDMTPHTTYIIRGFIVFAAVITGIFGLRQDVFADPILSPTPVASNADWTPVEMVLVPAGCFMMGSDGYYDRQPAHEVCFDEPFWIDKYEVTNAQYGSVGCSDDSSEPDQPRNCVDWFEAQDHCESRGARLPTEAEWEYAARGPDSLVFAWGNTYNADDVIGEDDTTYGDNQTAPVGSRPAGVSWVGTLDMNGNLWEWTLSKYRDYPYDPNDGRENMRGDADRAVRGGSFGSPVEDLRAASRGDLSPYYGTTTIGFRCARPAG